MPPVSLGDFHQVHRKLTAITDAVAKEQTNAGSTGAGRGFAPRNKVQNEYEDDIEEGYEGDGIVADGDDYD